MFPILVVFWLGPWVAKVRASYQKLQSVTNQGVNQ